MGVLAGLQKYNFSMGKLCVWELFIWETMYILRASLKNQRQRNWCPEWLKIKSCNISEDSSLHQHHCENLRSHTQSIPSLPHAPTQ
jgi:hypothetical protein